jgi:cation diffusion facilitator family transporter
MSHSNSTKAVIVALLGNMLIAVLKFVAAFFTQSASMSAEAIHSSADSLNQILLLIGNKRSKKRHDELHPFGYGREEFFWAFMVAILLFFGGAIYSIFEGIHKAFHPEPIRHFWWAIVVLGVSIIIESKSFLVAYNEMKKTTKGSLAKAIKKSVDTNLIVILLEDAAALSGLVVAFICTILATINPIFDAVGSIAIGLVLCYVSYSLVNELRKLIIGESMPRDERNKIKEIIHEYEIVTHINRIKTMAMGRNNSLLLLSLNVEDFTKAYAIEDNVEDMKLEIQKEFPQVSEIYIEISDR